MRRKNLVCRLVLTTVLAASAGRVGAQTDVPTPLVMGMPIAPPEAEPFDTPTIRAPLEATIVAGKEIRREHYPIIDGSTSTQWLGRLLGSHILGTPAELRRVSSGRTSEVVLTYPLHADAQQVSELGRAIRNWGTHFGTHQSYEALIEGKADLILVAREPSADEIKAARDKKVELDIRPIAMDALVFLVNNKNSLKSLTLEQLRSVYTGNITSWKGVGGGDEEIRAYTRDRNSGSEELMTKLVMQDRKIIQGGDRMMATMAGIIDGVSRYPNSLAYSVYYYAQIMNPGTNTRLLGVDGVTPTSATISSRQYPLVEPTYVIIRKGTKPDSAAVHWRDWLLSDDGQRLVAASGFAPVRVVAEETVATNMGQ